MDLIPPPFPLRDLGRCTAHGAPKDLRCPTSGCALVHFTIGDEPSARGPLGVRFIWWTAADMASDQKLSVSPGDFSNIDLAIARSLPIVFSAR